LLEISKKIVYGIISSFITVNVFKYVFSFMAVIYFSLASIITVFYKDKRDKIVSKSSKDIITNYVKDVNLGIRNIDFKFKN